MTLVPAYGRDYTSKAKLEADLLAGKDFRICDISHPDNGRYVNLPQLVEAGIKSVTVRYKRLASVTVIDVRKLVAKAALAKML